MHAAVAGRRVGLADQATAAGLCHLEGVTVEAVLRDDEEGEALRALRDIRVGAREQREHVGAPREGAPGLGAVDHPDVAAAQLAALGPTLDGGDVAAHVGLGDGDADHHLARGDPRQPVLLLLLAAALEQRLGEDLGPRDQRAGGRERRARELFGREDHGEVPELGAAVGFGHREAEVAELGHLRDEGLRHQRVAAVDALRLGRHLALGELAHRGAHLLRELVERQPIAAARGGDVASDLAQHGLAAGAAQAGAHAAPGRPPRAPRRRARARASTLSMRSRRLRTSSATPAAQVVSSTALPRPSLAASATNSTNARAARALGGGVGHALGEHLVRVDVGAVRGDRPRARERLREQGVGGGEQQAGVVETGQGSHGILGRPAAGPLGENGTLRIA